MIKRMTAVLGLAGAMIAFALAAHGREPAQSLGLGDPRAEELECLALNIYHEARDEPTEGQIAVAAVTLNRVASSAFPDTICSVVYNAARSGRPCAFSWTCDGRSDKPKEADAWRRAQLLARLAISFRDWDPSNQALYYHADYVRPYWSRERRRTTRIGDHIFYR